MQVKLVKASEITLEAADTQEQNLVGIFRGLMATATAGAKPTQAAIATAAHTTQGRLVKSYPSLGYGTGQENIPNAYRAFKQME
jgi:hypothetical protein